MAIVTFRGKKKRKWRGLSQACVNGGKFTLDKLGRGDRRSQLDCIAQDICASGRLQSPRVTGRVVVDTCMGYLDRGVTCASKSSGWAFVRDPRRVVSVPLPLVLVGSIWYD